MSPNERKISLRLTRPSGSRSDMQKRSARKMADKAPLTPTYFLSLTVENYRAFGPKQTLDLSDGNGRPAPWTVILGDNGTGKTSLLRGLVAMVPRLEKTLKRADGELWASVDSPLGSSDDVSLLVHLGAEEATWQAEYGYGAKICDLTNAMQHSSIDKKLAVHSRFSDGYSTASFSDAPIQDMALFAYGANRPIGTGSLSEYHPDGVRSLTVENSPLVPAEEWLLQQDLLARHGNGDAKQAKERLRTIIALLKDLLPEDDIQDVTFKTIDLNPSRQRIAVHIKTPYGEVPLTALSLGYRTLMAWMIDLTVQLFARYPYSPQPLHEAAVVLVDEIDLHLHPKWQRLLFSRLSEKFPNVQFIVTAHSPLIVQAATAQTNLVVLQRPPGASHVEIVRQPNSIRTWRLDQLMTSDLFGLPSARSPEHDAKYERKDALLRKPTLTKKEQAELAQLDEDLRSESSEEARYLDILRRAAGQAASQQKTSRRQPTTRKPRV
jgi:hypothetical protein